jgi:hypothetical protein
MTAATNVIFAEVHWTPSLMLQAEDRVHRIGQENSVNIYYMYGSETMDEIIFPVLTQKSHVIAETLDARRAEYNLRMKAKQGLNQEEINKLEEEADRRNKDKQKKQKASPSSDSSDRRLNKYAPIENDDDEDLEELEGLLESSESPQKEIFKREEKSELSQESFDISDGELMTLVESPSKPQNAIVTTSVPPQPNSNSELEESSSDEEQTKKEKSESELILEKLQQNKDFARVATEAAVKHFEKSELFQSTMFGGGRMHNLNAPLFSSDSKIHIERKAEENKVKNTGDRINVQDIKNAFRNNQIMSKTPKREFKTLEESVKGSSANDSSYRSSELQDAESLFKLLSENNEDTLNGKIDELSDQGNFDLDQEELEKLINIESQNESEKDESIADYEDLPIEYLDDDDKEI